jgi:pimeloyl-ACP methyl ester carboxylesterase
MLEPQANAFADSGRRVAWYDRRGTGGAPRADWPCGGVAQHADDAAAIVRALGGTAQVMGFSSGGVVAMALADRHPDLAVDIIAWEPAAIAALDGGLEIHDEIMKPIEAHLDEHPDDWTGAYALMLEIISGGHADLASAAVAAQLANAEAAVRDDARIITRHEFAAGSIPSARVRLARGGGVSDLHAGVIERLTAGHDLTTVVVDAALDHEVYLLDPEVLAAVDWSR